MTTGLTLEHVCKTYGDLKALDDLSFTVGRGELFGFVGSNGAGKTTTMRILLGVLSADSGRVLLDGVPLDAPARRRFGYMPAERGLYPKMKVGEQLVYFARLHGMTAAEATESMRHWIERLGVSDRVDDHVDTLSTGNQQRVQLAAALVHDPAVLVLDEPFSGLDPVAVDVMSEVLSEKSSSGVPVLFSSHQLELVEQLCDRVGIIADGSLVAVGTVDELRSGQPVRLEVVTEAPAGWADELHGVTTISASGDRFLLEVEDPSGDQDVLAAALRHGPVSRFGRVQPKLSELYREAVSA
ncbi:ATP-binding cassette domain-containing protein [Aeromicrobium sp. NPDC092404]|uniref:ABC transporter ATP-binding protein n=1 Tax=Aeromicrobium sp. NPDC092404 TaxID=3154976 RepID=UPI003444C0E3